MVSDHVKFSAGASSGAVELLDAGTWRMKSAVQPCCARACALAPAVVAVVTSLITALPRSRDIAGANISVE